MFSPHHRSLAFAILSAIFCVALSAGARADFTCPDDGSIDVADNVTGTVDHVLTVTPASGTSDDSNFKVEVYDPAHPSVVLSSVTITTDPLSNPPITVGPGLKARVVDPKDGDSKKPKGTTTFP